MVDDAELGDTAAEDDSIAVDVGAGESTDVVQGGIAAVAEGIDF